MKSAIRFTHFLTIFFYFGGTLFVKINGICYLLYMLEKIEEAEGDSKKCGRQRMKRVIVIRHHNYKLHVHQCIV